MVVTFGELMLRLTPPSHQRFVQTSILESTFGGGEGNVAVSLANYGIPTSFVTKLPKHEIAQSAINSLRRYGVDTSKIVRGGDRIGVYFLEMGASQRPSKVIYDRANSAINFIESGEIDWNKVFEGQQWFHWTGITPALGASARSNLVEACQTAQEMGLTISCDLNYRKKLWTVDEARECMKGLMKYVNVCIANEEDADRCLGLRAPESDVESGKLAEEGYHQLALRLKEEFDFDTVAITLRESHSASINGWSALMLDEKDCINPYRSKEYSIHLIDRVGGGDSFAGGLIYGLLKKNSSKEAVEFAAAASCLKQTIPGDYNLMTVEEVDKLAQGSGTGRVER